MTWNGPYTVPGGELERLTFDASGFLALYAGGRMNHKNETMQRGGESKRTCGGRDHAGRG